MQKIKKMLESAPSMESALVVLNWMHTYGSISAEEFKKGKRLIKKEFNNH
jgi:hypothetical protein